MIRVLYRFRVTEGEEEAFVRAWTEATQIFQKEVKGARGSQLFRSRDTYGEFMTLARWDSWEDWHAFRQSPSPARLAAEAMARISELVSTEVFEEVKDLLADQPAQKAHPA